MTLFLSKNIAITDQGVSKDLITDSCVTCLLIEIFKSFLFQQDEFAMRSKSWVTVFSEPRKEKYDLCEIPSTLF
jgi:hypothetical protein